MVFVRVTPNKKKETPAQVPTIENPDGFDEIEYYQPKKSSGESEMKVASNQDKEQPVDEKTGDDTPLMTEELTEKVFQRIIKEIKTGTSPYQACINKRVPPDIFFRECKKKKDWADELTEAREVFSESKVAQLEQLSAQLKRKTIDPGVYDKLTKTIIWMVERLFPSLYGNQAKVEFTTTHTVEIDQNRLKELNDMLRASQKVVEVEYQEVK